MGERPAEFLFDWEKESRGEGEHRKPQSCDRGKLLVATKRRGSHPKKCVGCNPGDDEANGNRHGSLREGSTIWWSVNQRFSRRE